MDGWIETIEPTTLLLLALVLVLGFILLSIVVGLKLRKLNKRYERLMGGTGVPDLSAVLNELHQSLAEQNERLDALDQRLGFIEQRVKLMKSNVHMVRYAAFGEGSSQLSFSIAILNEQRDGLVLTGIRTSDETYMYAKPITAGFSDYKLTPEEQEAITRSFAPEPEPK